MAPNTLGRANFLLVRKPLTIQTINPLNALRCHKKCTSTNFGLLLHSLSHKSTQATQAATNSRHRDYFPGRMLISLYHAPQDIFKTYFKTSKLELWNVLNTCRTTGETMMRILHHEFTPKDKATAKRGPGLRSSGVIWGHRPTSMYKAF